jgi:hypothetical protein
VVHSPLGFLIQRAISGSAHILRAVVKVDIDATSTGHAWQRIATIVGVTELTDEDTLVASRNLIVN